MKTPIKAIRANCLECCCLSPSAVRECHLASCPLHPYRMGHRPSDAERLAYEKSATRVPTYCEVGDE
jgi:hypothetical protein